MKYPQIKTSFSILLLALLLIACNSGEKYILEYKPEIGKLYSQKVLIHMDMSINQNNVPLIINFNLDMKAREKITDTANNLINSDTYIDEAVLTINYNNTEIILDSNSEDTIANLLHPDPIIKAITGIPFTAGTDKYGKVKSIKGLEVIPDRIISVLDPKFDPIIIQTVTTALKQNLIDENILVSLFQETPAMFPEKPVRAGNSWNIKKAKKKQKVKETSQTSLTHVSGNIATITTASTYEGALPINKAYLANEFKSFKGESNSVNKLDIHTGRTINSESIFKAEGEVELYGKTTPFTVDIKLTVTE